MSDGDKKLKKAQVEAALERLENLLRAKPGAVFTLHTGLDRARGIKLLDDLLDTDEGPVVPTYS